MRANDIAIQITVALEHPMRVGHTCGSLLRVKRGRVLAPFEGLPSRLGVYLCQASLGTRELSLFIVFGRAVPTTHQLQRTNAELRRLRIG